MTHHRRSQEIGIRHHTLWRLAQMGREAESESGDLMQHQSNQRMVRIIAARSAAITVVVEAQAQPTRT